MFSETLYLNDCIFSGDDTEMIESGDDESSLTADLFKGSPSHHHKEQVCPHHTDDDNDNNSIIVDIEDSDDDDDDARVC